VGVGVGCIGPAAANGDLIGTPTAPIDARVGVLERSGPTRIPTLEADSPAVDAGSPAAPGAGAGACEPTDQRGATRPAGPRCDIGALEVTDACVPGAAVLCLQGGRFAVSARYSSTAGGIGVALAKAFTPESGYFTFFDPDNVEVTVKVLDACSFNQRFWVFHAGMTNVEVELTVTDTATGQEKVYTNPLSRRYRTVTDTNAFLCN
jgi:hypothetical protein